MITWYNYTGHGPWLPGMAACLTPAIPSNLIHPALCTLFHLAPCSTLHPDPPWTLLHPGLYSTLYSGPVVQIGEMQTVLQVVVGSRVAGGWLGGAGQRCSWPLSTE